MNWLQANRSVGTCVDGGTHDLLGPGAMKMNAIENVAEFQCMAKDIVNNGAHIDRLVDRVQTRRVDRDQPDAFGGRPTAKMRTSCSLVILLA